jgi:uncharacterized protein YndB with AHSA1/START domain
MTSPIPPIEGRTTLAVSRDRAFTLFTGSFGAWRPREYHIGSAEVADVVLEPHEGGRWFEPHEGGRWFERGVDGSECDWGRVLAWEPPERVLFTWQIGGDWQFDPEPSHASEIEVRFHADAPEQTTIEVEQRHFERLVGGESVHGAIEHGGGGWVALLAAYSRLVATETGDGPT